MVRRVPEQRAFMVTRELPDHRVAVYLIDEGIIYEAAQERPNRDVMGFVIPWSRNMIENECLRIARPELDRMVANA